MRAARAQPTATSPAQRRRAVSVTVPVSAVRLARDFRPQKTRSNLSKRSDGRYEEPYSAIVEREDEVSVLCVQRTQHRQVLVRHMPEREWQRIVRHGEEVYPGQEGESSLHIVASPQMSTLPRNFQTETAATQTTTTTTVAVHTNHPTPLLLRPSTPATATAAVAEPAVFDYFVAPESRVAKFHTKRKTSAFTALRLQVGLNNKSELQRVAREDCRAMLSVERRNIFLRQYQRDMQCRMSGVSLYTVGKELPEHFVQTFFMLVENAQALRRHQARIEANRVPAAQRPPQQPQSTNGHGGGRYLFTIDQASTNCGERLPFAGQAPADGFVVVTVGPTPDAFNAAWRPWNVRGRFSWMDDEGEDDNVPFVPYEYGGAEYLPLPAAAVAIAMGEETVDAVQGSSPLLPRFAEGGVTRKGSGLSSNATSPLGLSRSAVMPPFGAAQEAGEGPVCVGAG